MKLNDLKVLKGEELKIFLSKHNILATDNEVDVLDGIYEGHGYCLCCKSLDDDEIIRVDLEYSRDIDTIDLIEDESYQMITVSESIIDGIDWIEEIMSESLESVEDLESINKTSDCLESLFNKLRLAS